MENSRMKRAAVQRMEALGFYQVHVYQPESLFVKNGRKLARVAEPCDPWLMFACYGDRCFNQVGDSPMAAAEAIIHYTSMPALFELSAEIGKLTEALRARQA